MDKPEALRCAEWLDSEIRRTVDADIANLHAAAELRRLHALNAALLAALNNIETSTHDAMTAALARAAIARAEGEK